ncbi:DUF998 domain-containing protein [Micromonospora sp. MS34]|uniref:DUF998 domain-containing protein n=1 Tax=Micromonospora sp. MS34 TaxID=3385971 RepID=UPI0039A016E5
MRAVPVRAVVTAAAAPVLLVTGWTVAGTRQPAGYDPVRDTLSELAGQGATDRWIMTGCLVLLGCCYLGTAAVLHAAGLPARFLLALGGAATVGLVAFPRPKVGGSLAHGTVATVAVLALVLWPAATALRLPRVAARAEPPWAFRRPVALTGTLLLLTLFGWFVAEVTGGSRTGLAERVTAVAVAFWPLLAVLSARRAHRRWSLGRPEPPGSAADPPPVETVRPSGPQLDHRVGSPARPAPPPSGACGGHR